MIELQGPGEGEGGPKNREAGRELVQALRKLVPFGGCVFWITSNRLLEFTVI